MRWGRADARRTGIRGEPAQLWSPRWPGAEDAGLALAGAGSAARERPARPGTRRTDRLDPFDGPHRARPAGPTPIRRDATMPTGGRRERDAGDATPPLGSDGDLVRAAQADPAAFAALYERYVDAIYRYCLRRVGSPADAEDAASQTFTRAFGALTGFRARPELPGDGVRAWLFTIAHNVVVSGYRADRPTGPLDAAGDLPDPDPPPEEQAIAAERRDVLRQSVARLADEQRRVVELRLAGLSGPEIAAAIGRSHGAVKMLQLRAIVRLRDLLGDRLGPGDTTTATGPTTGTSGTEGPDDQ